MGQPHPSDETPAAVVSFFGEGGGATLLNFWHNLQWRISDTDSVSFIELALLFCHCKGILERVKPPKGTFVNVQKAVKKSAGLLSGCDFHSVIPGNHQATWARKCGRALPKGSICGARPFSLTRSFREQTRNLAHGYFARVSA